MSERPKRAARPLPGEIMAVAATWLARRDAGLDGPAQREFAAWREADPQHAAAWAQVSATWSRMDRQILGGAADLMIIELAKRRRRKRRARVRATSLLAAVGCFVAGWAMFLDPRLPAIEQPIASAAPAPMMAEGLSRRAVLSDGSLVELNGDAAFEVHFSDDRRAVTLSRGEAHFSVVKDRARPFVVSARGVEVKAVGTAFAVRIAPDCIDVLVTEGEIAVGRLPAVASDIVLPATLSGVAGERVIVSLVSAGAPASGRVEPVSPEELERELAWRGTRVEFSSTPLREAIAVFNARGRIRLVLADADLAGVRLSGVFNADNHQGFVRLLTTHYGVTARTLETGEIALSKAL